MSCVWRSLVHKRAFSLSAQLLKSKKDGGLSIDKVSEVYETIAYMSEEDIEMQKNFDQGRQFFFPSEHYLDRKKILRSIPNEINLLDLSSVDVDRIYGDLAKLDSDKSVQMKYYKKYLLDYSDPLNIMIQEFNGIDAKFKALRRNEISSLPLSPGAFYHKENLFKHVYNVVGFDKSISGLPLYSGKGKTKEELYPREFIEDLEMFRKNITVHKRDLNFMVMEKSSVNVDPRYLHKKSLNKGEENLNKFLDVIYKNEVPDHTIQYEDIDNYNLLPISNHEIYDAFENEVATLRNFLQKDIKFEVSQSGSNLLLIPNNDIKSNIYRLCELMKPSADTRSTPMIIIKYNLKDFNAFPNYTQLLNSRKRLRSLKRHLFKLFMINLESQLDTLIRIKYRKPEEMTGFIKNFKSVVNSTIENKILVLCKDWARPVQALNFDAFIHENDKRKPFKRIYFYDMGVYNKISPRSRNYHNHKKGFSVGCMKLSDLPMSVRSPK